MKKALVVATVITLMVSGNAQTKTNFVALRLRPAPQKGSSWLQVDTRSVAEISATETYHKGECFKMTVTALANKKRRLDALFHAAEPIAMSTRTHQQQGLTTGVEDVVVAYSDLKSSPGKLWNNINVFGPDISQETPTVLLNLRIANIHLNDDSRKSYLEQSVKLAEGYLKQAQAFSPLINRIVAQVGNLYNANVIINEVPLEKVTKDGYWLIVPNEDTDTDKAFIHAISAGQAFVSYDGEVEGFSENRLPFFLVIKATTMDFQPVVWHSEIGNLTDAATQAPANDVKEMVLTAAADANAAGERYLAKLMQRRLDTIRVGPNDSEGTNAKLEAFKEFFSNYSGSGFTTGELKSWFAAYVRTLIVVTGDNFSSDLQADGYRFATVINKRAERGDIQVNGSSYTLLPTTGDKGRFTKLGFAADCSGVSPSSVVQSHRSFLEDGDLFMVNESAGIVAGMKGRFDLQSPAGVALTLAQIKDWLTGLQVDQCVCRSGKIMQLRGAAAAIAQADALIGKLPKDRTLAASNDNAVYAPLRVLVDFLRNSDTSQADAALVQQALDGYTHLGFRLNDSKNWATWLDSVSSDLAFTDSETPKFYAVTAARRIYDATKERHKSATQTTTARQVFGDLLSNVQRVPPSVPDQVAIDRFLSKVTLQLPPYDGKHPRQVSAWLTTASYDSASHVWYPRSAALFAMMALSTLQTDARQNALTPDTYRWAVNVFSVHGDLLSNIDKKQYSQALLDSSNLSARPDASSLTEPKAWKSIEHFTFVEGADGKIVALQLSTTSAITKEF